MTKTVFTDVVNVASLFKHEWPLQSLIVAVVETVVANSAKVVVRVHLPLPSLVIVGMVKKAHRREKGVMREVEEDPWRRRCDRQLG